MLIIKSPATRQEFKEYYALRFKVLREPWGHPQGTEKDDYEPISKHFMAVDDQTGKIVGVVKVYEKAPGVAHFSHLAVKPELQRKGIGKMLVARVEEVCRAEGFEVIGCNARLETTHYFEKLGYHISALPVPYFSTVQVVWMEKKL